MFLVLWQQLGLPQFDNDTRLAKAQVTTVFQIRYPVATFGYFPISQNVGSVPFPYKLNRSFEK